MDHRFHAGLCVMFPYKSANVFTQANEKIRGFFISNQPKTAVYANTWTILDSGKKNPLFSGSTWNEW
jgi:hypothetical protein